MNTNKVRFVHVCVASAVMISMAIVAAMSGHTSLAGAIQDILVVLGVLVLTVLSASFTWNKS